MEQSHMVLNCIILSIVLAVAIIDDIRNYRIHNSVVLSGLVAGLSLSLIQGGFHGLLMSILAALIPVIILLPLFTLRMLGAGDIKLFCAIGAIMGIEFIFCSMVFAFLAGGVIALVIMLFRRNMLKRLMHIAAYLKSIYLSHSALPYTTFSNKRDGAKFHFSPAIAAGCFIQIMVLLK